jgi:hypothetical protein
MNELAQDLAAMPAEKRVSLERYLTRRVAERRRDRTIPRRRTEDRLPLSFAQRRLWFVQQLSPANSMYNIAVAVHITDTLSLAALEQSINEIIRRHEILRTSYPSRHGEPEQFIHAFARRPLPLVHLGDLEKRSRHAAIQAFTEEEAAESIEILSDAPIRMRLLTSDEQGVRLLLTIHHIACDGWSQGVFIRELTSIYQSFVSGKPAAVPELSIQYADYASWQHDRFQKHETCPQLDYWKGRLRNVESLTLAPCRRKGGTVDAWGRSRAFSLSEELSHKLKSLARESRVTLFVVLLAGFKTLLYRYTSQHDIVVGSPTANRRPVETEALIGCFINLLALRTDLSGDPSFRELLGRVYRTTMEGLAHQETPFDLLVQELRLDRNADESPLFRTLFVLHNTPPPAFEDAFRRWKIMETREKPIPFDMVLSMMESGPRISGSLRYNAELFDQKTIARLIAHLTELLEQIVLNPDLPLLDIDLSPGDSNHELNSALGSPTEQRSVEEFLFD